MFEKVYMVWDLYDGVRTGLADLNGEPHYFSCIFEEEFTDKFELSPIDETFLVLAEEQWKIYKEWEFLFHSGKQKLEAHPGYGGINPRYDELEVLLKEKISKLKKLKRLYTPEFELLPDQGHLPSGVLKETVVRWHEVT